MHAQARLKHSIQKIFTRSGSARPQPRAFTTLTMLATSLLVATLVLIAGSAQATLVGDDATIRRIAGGGPSVTDFAVTVGAGTELEFQGRHDIGATSIVLDWDIAGLGSVGFDSSNHFFEYLDLQEQGVPAATQITAVALTTNVTGLDPSRIFFSADSVSVDLTALSVAGPNPSGFSFVQLDLTFEPVTPIPEPGTALLVGSGLMVLAARRRNRVG